MSEKTFTEEEAMHLVAREVAKQRMADMERKMQESETRFISILAELKLQIEKQTVLIEKQSAAFEKSITEFREEIDRDLELQSAGFQRTMDNFRDQIKAEFATKPELQELASKSTAEHGRIHNKIDTQWTKLTVIMSVLIAVALAVQWIVNMAVAAKKIIN